MRVLAFDCWTKGIRHLERLTDAFDRHSLELTLVHTGSWGTEPGRPRVETIGTIRVRDISSYGRGSLEKVLDNERPAAVVLLSTEAFAHRAFIRYCRRQDVPTVHVFHGLKCTFNSDDAPRIEVHRRLWLLRAHIPKLLLRYLPVYARALKETKATRAEWAEFRSDVAQRFGGRYPKIAPADSRADKACVYIEPEIQFAIERYGYAPGDVHAVGNPDFMTFRLSAGDVGCALEETIDTERVMYIASGLVGGGYAYESEDQFGEHILRTHTELSKQGKRLVLKPHPSHVGRPFLTPLTDAGIMICRDEEFIDQLRGCCASIVEPSSAALIAALMGMPLFLTNCGSVRLEHFGDLFRGYPRSVPLSDVREFRRGLSVARRNVDKTKEWIRHARGPMPAEDMPERVARVVLSCIDRQKPVSRDHTVPGP